MGGTAPGPHFQGSRKLSDAKMKSVSPQEALELLANGAQLVDVREKVEWDRGHAPIAMHIPLNTLPTNLHKIERTAPVIVACRGGSRSASAAKFLMEQGYTVANLDGGMVSWIRQGLEVRDANGQVGAIA